MIKLDVNSEIFTRSVEDIITREELKKLLSEGRRLRVKHGIDATSPELHLGHAANLWKLRALQEAGHKAVILLGDTTTRIGDPTGKNKARPELSATIIKKNIKAIQRQAERILLGGPGLLEIRRSSEWYEKMSAPQFLKLLSYVTHARLIERDMFQARVKKGGEIFMHELIYPILQGYDSVMLKSDLTVIGSDQLFNEHMGRFLQEKFGQKPQVIVTLKILPGLEGGDKMSKSLGNYIGLSDTSQDKFGKTMRIPDVLIVSYLTAYTNVAFSKIKEIESKLRAGKNPMEAKLFLAEAIVKRYHGVAAAKKERERFLNIFSKHELPEELPTKKVIQGPWQPIELLLRLGLASSKSEARRLLIQGAVKVGGQPIRNVGEKIKVHSGTVIQVGKRKFVKIR